MKRKIVIIAGSENDLRPCAEGLEWLRQQTNAGAAKVEVRVIDVNQRAGDLDFLLDSLDQAEAEDVYTIIACASLASHLASYCDARLRCRLGNLQIRVIGVALRSDGSFEGWIDALAARLSITRVCGTQVICSGLGSRAFSKACRLAMSELPASKLKTSSPSQVLSLASAIDLATNSN